MQQVCRRNPAPTTAPDTRPCWPCGRSGAALAVLVHRLVAVQRRALEVMVRRCQGLARTLAQF